MARKKPEERQLSALEQRFAKFKPARSVLVPVTAVPTCFPQVDYIVRVGGIPLRRVVLIHGPSNEGKTQYCLGLAKSFVRRNHFVLWGDAERTTTIDWVSKVLGEDADSFYFRATKPSSYEAFVDEVRDFAKAIRAAREAGEVPPETGGLVIVDSLRKLVPEDIFKKIAREGAQGEKGSVDGMGGRAAQIKAAMNASWMDELTPLTDDTGITVVFIARETEDPNASIWDKKFGNDFKIGGGKAVFYDSALVLRIQREGLVVSEDEDDDGKKRKRPVGERHSVTLRKTKVAGKSEEFQVKGYFHSHLDTGAFDLARDAVELGLRLGVLVQAGSRIKWPSRGTSSFASRERLIEALSGAGADLELLEDECRSKFEELEPEGESLAEPEPASPPNEYTGE